MGSGVGHKMCVAGEGWETREQETRSLPWWSVRSNCGDRHYSDMTDQCGLSALRERDSSMTWHHLRSRDGDRGQDSWKCSLGEVVTTES